MVADLQPLFSKTSTIVSLAGFRVVLFLRVRFDFSLSLIRDSKGNTCLVTQGGRADVL